MKIQSVTSGLVTSIFVLAIVTNAPKCWADEINQLDPIACNNTNMFDCSVDVVFVMLDEGGNGTSIKFEITNRTGNLVIGGGITTEVILLNENHEDDDRVTVQLANIDPSCIGSLQNNAKCTFSEVISPGPADANPDGDVGLNEIRSTFNFLIPSAPMGDTLLLPAVRVNVRDPNFSAPEPRVLFLLMTAFAGLGTFHLRRRI